MPNFTMGSLFAGIGGFDLGFERAGFDVKWQVEIDPWCRSVLAKNFPNAERYEDVRTVGAHNLSRVDVVCGGFPCQDISNSGLCAGIDGVRSGLWKEMFRIIRDLRPRFVLIENVLALLRRGFHTVLAVLADLASIGFDAEWQPVYASDCGLEHSRARLWIIAYPVEDGRKGFLCRLKDKRSETLRPRRKTASLDSYRIALLRACQRLGEPAIFGGANGISSAVEQLGGYGNAVVPQIAEMYARRIREVLEVECG